MKIKVITNDGKMYTLPDKLTIADKIPTKEPEEMINDEKAQFLEDVKNAKVISLSDGVNYGLIKIPITEENMNRVVLTTNLNHSHYTFNRGMPPVKCRAYTVIPKGATKKIEFTLKQDGDIPFGLYISNSGYYLENTRYFEEGSRFYTNINGFLLSIPNTKAYGIKNERLDLIRADTGQWSYDDGSDRKYLWYEHMADLAKKSFTTPYPGNWFDLTDCLDFLGGEKFKTEGCRLILEEVENSLILTNKETKKSLIYTRRDNEEIGIEMQTFDFLFISRLLSERIAGENSSNIQCSAIIEDLKYIN